DKIGPLFYGSDQQDVFIGHSLVSGGNNTSEAITSIIDAEVKRIVEDGLSRARKILEDNSDELHIVGKALLEYETLSGDEIKALLKGEKPDRPSDADTPDAPVSSALPTSRKKPNGSTATA